MRRKFVHVENNNNAADAFDEHKRNEHVLPIRIVNFFLFALKRVRPQRAFGKCRLVKS